MYNEWLSLWSETILRYGTHRDGGEIACTMNDYLYGVRQFYVMTYKNNCAVAKIASFRPITGEKCYIYAGSSGFIVLLTTPDCSGVSCNFGSSCARICSICE